MNEIFKGLLFLHGYLNVTHAIDRDRAPEATGAGDTSRRPRSNRKGPRRWFGKSVAVPPAACVDCCC